jgi:hypothetical protein
VTRRIRRRRDQEVVMVTDEVQLTEEPTVMKQDARTMDRRTFTLEAALAALSGVVITISCGGGSGYSSSPSTTPAAGGATKDQVGLISANHGHVAIIVAAQMMAGNAVQLDIRGTADHTHTVSLSATAIGVIAAGQPVATDSTMTRDHDHTVTFNADAPGVPARY